jgi:hypothetical protein
VMCVRISFFWDTTPRLTRFSYGTYRQLIRILRCIGTLGSNYPVKQRLVLEGGNPQNKDCCITYNLQYEVTDGECKCMLKQRTLSFEYIFTVTFQDFVDETDLLLTKIAIPLIPHFMKKSYLQ